MEHFVPLFQTVLWVGLIIYAIVLFRVKLENFLEAVRVRIEKGSSFKAGPVELGQDLKGLERVASASSVPSDIKVTRELATDDKWNTERDGIKKECRGIFLGHVLEPSKQPGQKYDIFIFLVRDKSTDFSDVAYAEFFFGRYWDNHVFRETEKQGKIGVATSAYGPFLCICRVTFKDGGQQAHLYRYIDFEMARLFR